MDTPSDGPNEASAGGAGRAEPNAVDLNHIRYYLNRELSWLDFNRRVLEEAEDPAHPLLERVKFLSIFAANLDEFFMIRVSGLRNQLEVGALKRPPDGMTPAEQQVAIRDRLQPMREAARRCFRDQLLPALRQEGIRILAYEELKNKQRKLLRRHFTAEILPALTPLAFDPSHPFPHISNLSLSLAVVVNDPGVGQRFARLKVPDVFPRLVPIPSEEKADAYEKLGLRGLHSTTFVWLEEVIAANVDLLFPGLEVVTVSPFRVTRDADVEIEEDEASDLLSAMKEVVGQRHFGSAVRLQVDGRMPGHIREILERNLRLAPYQVYVADGPIGTACLAELTRLDRPDLKDPPFIPSVPPSLATDEDVFSVLRRHDVLLHHPYDSFTPVVDFLRAAASDPDVLAIKQTLYRVGPNSPVVQTLMEARENGKQVAVLVELKARFDEENNIVWAKALERDGVHVVYGVLGLKTHAKMLLVVRREADGIRRYVHLATGNYNPVTARVYTDIGLFTCDPEIATDVSDLFNALTGYSRKERYAKLLVAPAGLRRALLERVDREVDVHRRNNGGGHIVFKMNALVDKACIRALYRAAQAGVKVDLQVRGICCLRPGLAGLSETVTVTSVVGRFLEHSRLYYFRNGGAEELLVGSADLMPRNLDGRVEVVFPVSDPRLLQALKELLLVHLRDTARARRLKPDGSWERVKPAKGDKPLDSQRWMMEHRGSWHGEE